MTRELIDSELDTVAGGLFDAGVVLQSIDARQTATANANGIGLTKVNLKDVIKQRVKEASLLAWSRDGSQLAYQPMGYKDIFIINFVRRAS